MGAGLGAGLGVGLTDMNANYKSKAQELQRQINAASGSGSGDLEALAAEEQAKRRALGELQRGQINEFADQQEKSVGDYRSRLASSLANTAQDTFQQANPGLLEDLNSRGLFTSQTARDESQGRLLKELASQQQGILSNFDTQQFGNIQDIRGTGLSAMLGGDQSALDSALELRKAGIQHSFNQADQQKQMAFAQMMANQQQRNSLISSILGLGGQLGAGYLAGR